MTKEINPLQRLMLLAVLALLGSIVIMVFLIIPRISELKELSTKAAAKEAELETGKKKVAALRNAVQLIKTARRDMDILGVAVPADKDIAEALVQVNANALSSGVAIEAISTSEGGAGSINISATVLGSYEQVMNFLANTEKNLRPIKIADYSLVSSEGAVDATFSLLFPYLENEAAAAKASQAAAEGESGMEGGVESGQ